jgi:hypothetical protein
MAYYRGHMAVALFLSLLVFVFHSETMVVISDELDRVLVLGLVFSSRGIQVALSKFKFPEPAATAQCP